MEEGGDDTWRAKDSGSDDTPNDKERSIKEGKLTKKGGFLHTDILPTAGEREKGKRDQGN